LFESGAVVGSARSRKDYCSQGERVGGTSTETGGRPEYTYPLVLASGAGARILNRRYHHTYGPGTTGTRREAAWFRVEIVGKQQLKGRKE